jgi:ATP-binding cassette subfamily B protein
MHQLRALLPYLYPYRRGMAAGLLLVVISNAFGILTPLLIGITIDALGAPGVTGRKVAAYASAIVLTALLAGAGRYGMRELLNGISRRVETDLRQRFFEHLLRLDATFYGGTRTGDLMSRATNDTSAVRMAAGPAVMYLVNTIVMTAFSLALMVRISPGLTLIALLPFILLPGVALGFGRMIHQRFERIQDHLGQLSTLVQENLAGARIIRAYAQEEVQEREFEELNAGYLDKNMALARISALFQPLLALLAGVGMVIVLWTGGARAMSGEISIGDFVAFGFYLTMLTWPMISLGWVINLLQRGAASMGRLQTILTTEPAITDPAPALAGGGLAASVPGPRAEAVSPADQLSGERDKFDDATPRPLPGEIEFQEVRFRYPGTEREVLSGISFRVPAGQTVALVGPTGSGKSTIIALLQRLYDPTAGTVLIDGTPLPELPLAQIRDAIGIVPQDAFVFSGTIAENIAFGIPPEYALQEEAADERVREAATIARLDETIAAFPDGYQTRLGERGINLSGGQRQRTTLARALARDPSILILDDALSAVDTQTETEILHGLRRVLRDRTALIVSHRVSAVMDADWILVLDDGRVAEEGTHTELIERDGLYATLLRRQLLSEALAEGAAREETLATTAGEQ